MNVRSLAGLILIVFGSLVSAVAQPPERVEPTPQTGHTAGVTAVAFRPDAAHVLTASSDGTAILWDAENGRQLRKYTGGPLPNSILTIADMQFEAEMPASFPLAATETPAVSSLEFSPDGQSFVMLCQAEGLSGALGANSLAIVWETVSGKRIGSFDLGLDAGTVALSPDGSQLLSGGQPLSPEDVAEGELIGMKIEPFTGVALWDMATGKMVRQFDGYDTVYSAVRFSPDGQHVLGAGQDLSVVPFEPPADAQQMQAPSPDRLPAPSLDEPPPPPPSPKVPAAADEVPDAVPQPPSSPAAVERQPVGIVRIWEAATGKEVLAFRPRSNVIAAEFSPSGDQVLLVCASEMIEIWDPKTKTLLLELPAKMGAFSPDGNQVVAVDSNGTVAVWDVASSKRVHEMEARFDGVKSMAISPDGMRLLVGMTHEPPDAKAKPTRPFVPGEAVLLGVSDGRVVQSFAARTDAVDFVAVSPNGRYLLTGDNLWRTASGRKVGNLCNKPVQVFSAAFSPDTGSALVANHEASHFLGGLFEGLFGRPPATAIATVAEIPSGKELVTFEVNNRVSDRVFLGFSRDGRRAFTAVATGSLSVWDVASGKRISESLIPCYNLTAAFSPDGKLAALSFQENKTLWWDCQTGEKVADKGREKGQTIHAGMPPVADRNGKRQISVSEDSTGLVVEDMANRDASRTLKADATSYEFIQTAGFDARDDRFVFAEVSSPYTGFWDLDAGKRLRAFPDDEPFSSEVIAFGPKGRYVVTAGNDGGATIWEVATLKKVSTVKLESPIMAAAFSPDGTQWAAGCADRTVVVKPVSPRTGVATLGMVEARVIIGDDAILRGHEGPVHAVAFGSGGRLLITACREDGTARIWDVATGKELARIISIGDRTDWLVITPEGFYDGSEGGRKRMAFRVGDGLDVQSAARFAETHFRPGLLAEIWLKVVGP